MDQNLIFALESGIQIEGSKVDNQTEDRNSKSEDFKSKEGVQNPNTFRNLQISANSQQISWQLTQSNF
jgi:5'(3')-deoxyribonucleotidase